MGQSEADWLDRPPPSLSTGHAERLGRLYALVVIRSDALSSVGRTNQEILFVPGFVALSVSQTIRSDPWGLAYVSVVSSDQVVQLIRGCEVARVGVSPPVQRLHPPCVATRWPDRGRSVAIA